MYVIFLSELNLTGYTRTWSLIAYNTSSTTDNINGLQFIATSMFIVRTVQSVLLAHFSTGSSTLVLLALPVDLFQLLILSRHQLSVVQMSYWWTRNSWKPSSRSSSSWVLQAVTLPGTFLVRRFSTASHQLPQATTR